MTSVLFRNYTDNFKLITQNLNAGADGGDTCHRTTNILACLKLMGEETSFDKQPLSESYFRCMNQFETAPGIFIRHPDVTRWYSRPENFSRDQMIMALWAMLSFHDAGRARAAWKQMVSRRFMNQNTHPNHQNPGDAGYLKKTADPMTPGQLAMFIRAINIKLAYPLLVILDAFLLVDIGLNAYDDYKSKKKNRRTDAYTMMAAVLLSTKQSMDTPTAWLARKLMRLVDYKGAIEWIFSTPENNDPPIHKIYLPLCEKYIDNNNKIV